MDINQQLEYLNLSSDVLTEDDVLDTVQLNPKKLVSAKGIYEALYDISNIVSTDFITKDEVETSISKVSDSLSNYQPAGSYISGNVMSQLATKDYVTSRHFLSSHQSLSDYYTKSQVSSSEELDAVLSSLSNTISALVTSSDFQKILSNYVTISAWQHYLSSNEICTAFENIKNMAPMTVISTALDKYDQAEYSQYIDYNIQFIQFRLSQKINEVIIYFNLPIDLIDDCKKQRDTSFYIYIVNKISEITGASALKKKAEFEQIIEKLNENIVLLNNSQKDLNLEQSISALNSIAQSNKTYASFLASILNSTISSLDDYAKNSDISTAEELKIKFEQYALSDNVYGKVDVNDILLNYALSSDVSSNSELSTEFSRYAKSDDLKKSIKEYKDLVKAVSSDVSSASELTTELNKYLKISQFNSEISNYAKSDSVYNKKYINDEFKKYQKAGNYALSSDVSSKAELAKAFAKCSTLSINVSSDAELSTEFKKYELTADLYNTLLNYSMKCQVSSKNELATKFTAIQNYLESCALSSEVSSAAQLSTMFEQYALITETSTAAELSDEFAKYVKSASFNLSDYALSNAVSSKYQLSAKFNYIDDKLNDAVYVTCDSDISGNINIQYDLSSNKIYSTFKNIKNTDPLTEISNIIDIYDPDVYKKYLEYDITYTIFGLCEKINEAIIYFKLPIDLIEDFKRDYDVEYLVNAVNKICEVTRIKKLDDDSDINDVIQKLNQNIIKLNNIQTDGNAEQTVSALNSIAQSNKNYIKYISYLVNNVISVLDECVKRPDVSTVNELDVEFQKYAKNDDVYDKSRIDDMIQNCAKIYEVSSRVDLIYEFAKYAKLEQLNNYVKNYKLSSYLLKNDLCSHISDLAPYSYVSSANDISSEFKEVADEMSLAVFKDRDSSISGNVDLLENTFAKNLSANWIKSNFQHIVNEYPQFLLSTKVLNLNGNEPLGIIFSRVNQIIFDADLQIPLLSTSASRSSDMEHLLSTLNLISKNTTARQILSFEDLGTYINIINQNIEELSTELYSYNVQQSLSGLARYIKTLQYKSSYNTELIQDVIDQMETSYGKSQTSSKYEIKNALSRKQDKGEYVYLSNLTADYATIDYVDSNFVSGIKPVVIDSIWKFNNDVRFNGKVTSDFANIIDVKNNEALSGYIHFVVTEHPFELATKLNQIIQFCDLDIKTIHEPQDIYKQIFNTLTKICVYAKMPVPEEGATYFDMKNTINLVILKLNIKHGLSLATILDDQNYTIDLIMYYMIYQNKHINYLSAALSTVLPDQISANILKLSEQLNIVSVDVDVLSTVVNVDISNDICCMSSDISTIIQNSSISCQIVQNISDDLYDLSSKVIQLSSENIEISGKYDDLYNRYSSLQTDYYNLKNALSDFSTEQVGDDGNLNNVNTIISTLIICLGGRYN